MPAVFKIVSRVSGQALTTVGVPEFQIQQWVVVQFPQVDQNPNQWWTLAPQDSAQDFLIQSLGRPGAALGVDRTQVVDPTQPAPVNLQADGGGQVWRISRIPHPPYFFLLEGNNDLLMDLPAGTHQEGDGIQVSFRNEHQNQQWTFLPVFEQLP